MADNNIKIIKNGSLTTEGLNSLITSKADRFESAQLFSGFVMNNDYTAILKEDNINKEEKLKLLSANKNVQNLMKAIGATFDLADRVDNFTIDKNGIVTFTSGDTTYMYTSTINGSGRLIKTVTKPSEKFEEGVVTEFDEWIVNSLDPSKKTLKMRINNKNGEKAGTTIKDGRIMYADGITYPRVQTNGYLNYYVNEDGSIDRYLTSKPDAIFKFTRTNKETYTHDELLKKYNELHERYPNSKNNYKYE